MQLRAPFMAPVLACAFLALVPSRPITAAEIAPEQRQAIEGIIHDYLMQNPDVLIEALRAAEDKANRDADAKAALVLKDRRGEVFDDPATPVGGNPQGDVTIVEFFDYRCPYCKQVQPALQTLIDQDPKLRFVYKEMPVLGAPSVTAAHAALAARLQGRYEAFHAAMMATKGQITEEPRRRRPKGLAVLDGRRDYDSRSGWLSGCAARKGSSAMQLPKIRVIVG